VRARAARRPPLVAAPARSIAKLDTTLTGGSVEHVPQRAPLILGDFGPGPNDPRTGAPIFSRLGPGVVGPDYTTGVAPAPCRTAR